MLDLGLPELSMPMFTLCAHTCLIDSTCWAWACHACVHTECSHLIHPQHVLGLGLPDLSMAQLDALELLHHTALARCGFTCGEGGAGCPVQGELQSHTAWAR